ncbi:MAG: tetraacyldisaccharide 4'-kinase [Proteobacteria bacterium]|nr:tetraacyldisaccharide 4'-kinase [Pseudomonadota bacterium]
MRAPDFWKKDDRTLSRMLMPLAWCYGLGGRLRRFLAHPVKAGVPVLCVGNFVAGGAGKTPVALSLGKYLIGRGRKVHYLSRGYGGRVAGPFKVDPDVHNAAEVGDESLLLAAVAPTWISRDRAAGVHAAAGGADLIIMDDGFQNPTVEKDLSLLVVDGRYGFGNGRVIPAGPLRETIALAIERADALIVIGPDKAHVMSHPALWKTRLPVLKASVKPGPEAKELTAATVVAFAGIGNPEKFFKTLQDVGCKVKATHAYADHHPYTEKEIERLKEEAETGGAKLVTTEKDAMRLSDEALAGILVLPISLEWADEKSLDDLLQPFLGG